MNNLTPPILIWTRSKTDWYEDEKVFTLSKNQIIHIPCIEDQSLDLSFAEIKKDLIDDFILVFTSTRSLRFLEICKEYDFTKKLAYCVGEQTKKKLETFPIQSIHPPEVKDGRDLFSYIIKNIPTHKKIIMPGAKKQAFPLQESLQQAGFFVKHIPVYETILLNPSVQPILCQNRGVICFASPSAVDSFFAKTNLKQKWKNFSYVAIGKTTQKALENINVVGALSEKPSIASLIKFAESKIRSEF